MIKSRQQKAQKTTFQTLNSLLVLKDLRAVLPGSDAEETAFRSRITLQEQDALPAPPKVPTKRAYVHK